MSKPLPAAGRGFDIWVLGSAILVDLVRERIDL